MRRKNRVTVKIIVFLFLLVFAGILLRERLGSPYHTDVYSERWVGLTEVGEELTFGVYTREEWKHFFDVSGGKYLTGDILGEILAELGVEDYIEVPELDGRRAVGRADWEFVYEQVLDLLDMGKTVQREKLLILDVMEAKEQNVLITNHGDYYTALPVSYFEMWKGYEVYVVETQCLGIVGATVEELHVNNAYLEEYGEGEIKFLFGGDSYRREMGKPGEDVSAGVCDIGFAGGEIVSLRMKRDLIEGAVLSYDEAAIEIEGYGKISHPGKIPVYQTYGETVEKSLSDVILGNMQVAYVTGENQVCAILIRHPATIENIRVLLLAADGGNFRREVFLKSDVPLTAVRGAETGRIEVGTVISAADALAPDPTATLTLTPEGETGGIYLCDAAGTIIGNPYRGTMEVRSYEQGYTLVNSLDFEKYLYAVVPSEMPSSYGMEALKAQAVCARSYAYIQLLRADLAQYGAHINDSTSYQVYNKVGATEASIRAVDETAGQMLTYGGNPVEAYYFSTSMGYTDTAAVWNRADDSAYGYLKSACLNTAPYEGDLSEENAFLDYIQKPAEGYDSDVKYYRWFVTADYREKTGEIGQELLARRAVSEKNVRFYGADGGELVAVDADVLEDMGDVTGLLVAKRSQAGSILELRVTYENGAALVQTEYNIRKVLGTGMQKIVYADSTETAFQDGAKGALLPSAFCAIVPNGDGSVTLQGGGYGHGLGMSQNAANGMAKAGMNYEEILHYFYNDIKIGGMQ
ncbi:MAG: SpoIID/LytB domain-containing protein [Roseburia sp.]